MATSIPNSFLLDLHQVLKSQFSHFVDIDGLFKALDTATFNDFINTGWRAYAPKLTAMQRAYLKFYVRSLNLDGKLLMAVGLDEKDAVEAETNIAGKGCRSFDFFMHFNCEEELQEWLSISHPTSTCIWRLINNWKAWPIDAESQSSYRIKPFKSIDRKPNFLEFIHPPDFEDAVNALCTSMEPKPSGRTLVVYGFRGSRGTGKTRACVEACWKAFDDFSVANNIEPLVMQLTLPNRILSKVAKKGNPMSLVAAALVVANGDDETAAAKTTLNSLVEKLAVQFKQAIPPILLHIDEAHADHALAKRLVQGCIEIRSMSNNLAKFRVAPVVSGSEVPYIYPLPSSVSIEVTTLDVLDDNQLLGSFSKAIGLSKNLVEKSDNFYRLFRLASQSPYVVDRLAGFISDLAKQDEDFRNNIHTDLSMNYARRLYEMTLESVAETFGTRLWHGLLHVPAKSSLNADADALTQDPYDLMTKKLMEIIFCEAALGIVIPLSDLATPLVKDAPQFPTYEECEDAGLLRLKEIQIGRYVVSMPIIGLMHMNELIHILPQDVQDPFHHGWQGLQFMGPTSIYLHLRYAQLRECKNMVLSNLRPTALANGPAGLCPADIKINIPTTFEMIRLGDKITGKSNDHVDVNTKDAPPNIQPGMIALAQDSQKTVDYFCFFEGFVDSGDFSVLLSGRIKNVEGCANGKESKKKPARKDILKEMDSVAQKFIKQFDLEGKRKKPVRRVHDVVTDRKKSDPENEDELCGVEKLKEKSVMVTRRKNVAKALGPLVDYLSAKRLRPTLTDA